MNDNTRDAIIDDILKKYPIGPSYGPGLEYLFEDVYNYSSACYERIKKCSDPNYGYEDATLFSLGLKNLNEVKVYVINRWFECKTFHEIGSKKSTVTRRSNRIWERINNSVRRQERAGGKGIYKVTRAYSFSELGYVYSNNAEEAKTMANMFFPADPTTIYTVTFIEIGSVDRLYHYNAKIKESYERQIDQQQCTIKECTKRIKKYTNFMTMLSVLEGHQVAVEAEV